MGNLIWTPDTDPRPMPKTPESVKKLMGRPFEESDVLLSYLDHIVRNQWTLNDLQNPFMVEKLVETRGRCEPFALREEVGFDL